MERLREIVDRYLQEAQAKLSSYGGFYPSIIGITENEQALFCFDPDDGASTEKAQEALKEMAKNEKILGIGYIANVLAADTSVEEEVGDLSKRPDAFDVIVATIYTRKNTEYRHLHYAKKEDGDYLFFDKGWETPDDNTATGDFGNPWK